MKDWKGLVRTVAPALATALGGPMAGIAVREIGGKLLGNSEAGEDAVAAAVASSSPETLLKLKELDQTFSKQMAELGVELEKIDAGDRANAREREKALKDWVPSALAVANLAAFFTLLFMILTHTIPAPNRDAFNMLLGMLAGNMLTVMTYYFGSSHGSRAKDEVIGRAVGR